jgi:hypothetical protein
MTKSPTWRIGQWINSAQSSFVGLLRMWSIPIVLMLSVASGYTTYYGMSHFITGWIALIITIAVQSILVICSLELASVHWRANPRRYLSILGSLLVAVGVSISFSYFKFYEISQAEAISLERLGAFRQTVDSYVAETLRFKSEIMTGQRGAVEAAAREANQAYLGAHPDTPPHYRGKVGRGPLWSYFHALHQAEQDKLARLEQSFAELDRRVQGLRAHIGEFAARLADPMLHAKVEDAYQAVQAYLESIASSAGRVPPRAPVLSAYSEFSKGVTPSFAMWERLSWFALACAAMVDFFAVILSYRLEFTAPGPLTEDEKELAYLGLKQFSEFRINHNGELEVVIEKSELERARRVSDWTRMFSVAFLLNRGFMRKVNERSVEFAPTLYPLIAERMQRQEFADRRDPEADNARLGELVRRKLHG